MRGNVQKIQENPRKSRKSKKTKEHQRKSKKIQENPLTCAFLAGGPISTFPLIGVTFGQHRKIQQFQEGARKLQEMQGICHKCVKCARECKGNPKNQRKSKKIQEIKEHQRKSKKIQENPRKSKNAQPHTRPLEQLWLLLLPLGPLLLARSGWGCGWTSGWEGVAGEVACEFPSQDLRASTPGPPKQGPAECAKRLNNVSIIQHL